MSLSSAGKRKCVDCGAPHTSRCERCRRCENERRESEAFQPSLEEIWSQAAELRAQRDHAVHHKVTGPDKL